MNKNYCLIVYDTDTLDIFYGLQLVTTHHRDDTPYGYTRKEAHNLPGRHGSYEKDLNEVFEQAAQIDNIVLLYLKDVASQKKYMPLAFRSCRGILALEKTFGLDSNLSLPHHKNIRGREYFSKSTTKTNKDNRNK